MNLETYLSDIKARYGVRRISNGIDAQKAREVFIMTADAMLDWKGGRYDYKTMDSYIDRLIGWSVCSQSCGLDLTRGILLKGATGRGKTFLFQIWKEWLRAYKIEYTINGERKRMELTMANARTIASDYQQNGAEVIARYAAIPVLLIDDIGAESREQNSYGNRVNVVNDILDKRQEKNLLTFGTTNFNELTPEAGYDDRMKRRINALFNVISINHNNRY